MTGSGGVLKTYQIKYITYCNGSYQRVVFENDSVDYGLTSAVGEFVLSRG